MPVYFPVRADPNNVNTPLIVTQDANNANKPQGAHQFGLNFMAQAGQGILVNHANAPSLAFGNLAQFRAHNFITGLMLNQQLVFNNVNFANFLALFDDIFLEACVNTGNGVYGLQPEINRFGTAYKRVIGELAGCSVNIALTRRVALGAMNQQNVGLALADYAQIVNLLNLNQANNRADYIWLTVQQQQNNLVVNEGMVVESKGSVLPFVQATLDRAVVQTFDSVNVLDNAQVCAPSGISGYMYVPGGQNGEWELAIIDPDGEVSEPTPIDPDAYFKIAASKFAVLTSAPKDFSIATMPTPAEKGLEVYVTVFHTSTASYELCIPKTIGDVLLSGAVTDKGTRGLDLFGAIADIHANVLEQKPVGGDFFFGEYLYSGEGFFVRCLKSYDVPEKG